MKLLGIPVEVTRSGDYLDLKLPNGADRHVHTTNHYLDHNGKASPEVELALARATNIHLGYHSGYPHIGPLQQDGPAGRFYRMVVYGKGCAPIRVDEHLPHSPLREEHPLSHPTPTLPPWPWPIGRPRKPRRYRVEVKHG